LIAFGVIPEALAAYKWAAPESLSEQAQNGSQKSFMIAFVLAVGLQPETEAAKHHLVGVDFSNRNLGNHAIAN
jgi:hypothetical protein